MSNKFSCVDIDKVHGTDRATPEQEAGEPVALDDEERLNALAWEICDYDGFDDTRAKAKAILRRELIATHKQAPVGWFIDVKTHGISTGRYELAAKEFWGDYSVCLPLYAALPPSEPSGWNAAVEALKLWKIAADNSEECEFDDVAHVAIPMPLFHDADEATDAALSRPPADASDKEVRKCGGDGDPCPVTIFRGKETTRCEQNGVCQRVNMDNLPTLNLSIFSPPADETSGKVG